MSNAKQLTASLVCALFLAGLTLGCANVRETLEENPRTAIGAGVGTLGGAIIGGTVFDSAGAAVAGGLIGGLAGGLIGRALESKDEDYVATARDYDHRRGEGTLVRVEAVDADPSRVEPRDRVHLVTRYAVLPKDPEGQVRVTERWEITHNGRVVGNPTLTVRRNGGTWSSAIPLDLPVRAEDGVYRARVTIEAEGGRDQGTTTFRVG